MINDDEFKASLREAVLDFLKKNSRVPTQKELKSIYGIKPYNLDYFKTSRGYKSMQELLEECVGPEVLGKFQIPFEEKLKPILLKHMDKFGCLPSWREYDELCGISYGYLRFKARKKGLSTKNYLWSLVRDDIKGTPLEKCFVRPEPQKREYDRDLIKKRLQEGYGISAVAKELKTGISTLERFLKQNDLEKYIPDQQTRLRKAKGKKDLRQYHDYIKKSLEEGRTIYQIAKELDVEFKSLRTYVKNWKLWHLHKPIGPPPPHKKFRFE